MRNSPRLLHFHALQSLSTQEQPTDSAEEPKTRSEVNSDQLKSELDQIWIPDVALESEDFDIAFALVIQKAVELTPNPPRAVPYNLNASVSSDIKISIDAATIKYTNALDVLCYQAGLKWSIRDGTLVFDDSD